MTDIKGRRKPPPLASDWHRVSGAYRLRFTLIDGAMEVQWGPTRPSRSEIEPLLPSYREALHEFFGGAFERGVRKIGPFRLREIEVAS